MDVMDKLYTVSGTFVVKASTGYFDDEATAETLRYSIEQDLEDLGYEAEVSVLREQKPIAPVQEIINDAIFWHCGKCGAHLTDNYCPHCGREVDWNG